MRAFLKPHKGTPQYPKLVAIGIAGPRKGNKVKITNAHWPEFDIKEVEKELGFEALYVLNDFEANGYGILGMTREMYTEVTKIPAVPGAPKILLGTGTGLGEAIVTKGSSTDDYIVFPGEGGHVDFAPRNEAEFGFMLYVKKKLNLERVSYERCCCGLAIPLMFDYLNETMKKDIKVESKVYNDIRERLMKLLDLLENSPSDESINKRIEELDKEIFNAGMSKEDKVCEATVDMFASLYGAEVGNMALKILPYGGIYLLSSVTLAMKDHIIKEKTFLVIL
jgi:glucokinase